MLAVPLTQAQVDAANDLHATVDQWRVEGDTLQRLAKLLPGWSREESRIKCVILNSLYATQVYAIARMADHVSKVFTSESLGDEVAIVERIARLGPPLIMKPRNYVSFASKLCHIFISEGRFPIYDTVARETLKFHLGKRYEDDAASPYASFVKNFWIVSDSVGISTRTRRLDRYLWLVGLYRRWLKGRQVNSEFRRILSGPTSDQRAYLVAILPSGVPRKFRLAGSTRKTRLR
jgi:hypothetical protein